MNGNHRNSATCRWHKLLRVKHVKGLKQKMSLEHHQCDIDAKKIGVKTAATILKFSYFSCLSALEVIRDYHYQHNKPPAVPCASFILFVCDDY